MRRAWIWRSPATPRWDQSDKEHVKFITASSVAMDGMNMETTVFYEDGYYYMEAMGQKMKYPWIWKA